MMLACGNQSAFGNSALTRFEFRSRLLSSYICAANFSGVISDIAGVNGVCAELARGANTGATGWASNGFDAPENNSADIDFAISENSVRIICVCLGGFLL